MSGLLTSAGSAIDRVRINALTREERGGRIVWVKRRLPTSPLLIRGANLFFRLAHNPIAVWLEPEAWQRWEVECFLMLNGDAYCAFPEGPDAVCADALPGESLCRRLDADALEPAMMTAAGRELRRAHSHTCAHFGGPWSHGDPHLGNFLFEAGRCRMIDFEVAHHRTLGPDERHADDLLVPLLDLCGRIAEEKWLPFARAFLDGYGRPQIARRLRGRLRVPHGIPRLWWAIRTGYVSRELLAWRMESLRDALP